MKKLGCAKCGGTKKMKLGGSAVAKAPVNIFGIPQENMGTSSQMGFGKKGGTVKKEHVLTTFRKANEARQAVVKKSLPKAQDGRITDTTKYRPWDSPNIKPAPYMNPRETLRLEQLKAEQKERLKGNQDNYKIDKSTGKMQYSGPKTNVKKLGGAVKSKKKK